MFLSYGAYFSENKQTFLYYSLVKRATSHAQAHLRACHGGFSTNPSLLFSEARIIVCKHDTRGATRSAHYGLDRNEVFSQFSHL